MSSDPATTQIPRKNKKRPPNIIPWTISLKLVGENNNPGMLASGLVDICNCSHRCLSSYFLEAVNSYSGDPTEVSSDLSAGDVKNPNIFMEGPTLTNPRHVSRLPVIESNSTQISWRPNRFSWRFICSLLDPAGQQANAAGKQAKHADEIYHVFPSNATGAVRFYSFRSDDGRSLCGWSVFMVATYCLHLRSGDHPPWCKF